MPGKLELTRPISNLRCILKLAPQDDSRAVILCLRDYSAISWPTWVRAACDTHIAIPKPIQQAVQPPHRQCASLYHATHVPHQMHDTNKVDALSAAYTAHSAPTNLIVLILSIYHM